MLTFKSRHAQSMSANRICCYLQKPIFKVFLSSNSGAGPQLIFAAEVDAVHQTSSMQRGCGGKKKKKCDRGTPSHLVVDRNQCLAWTIFGHWSLQHHAGPAVLLSKHCAWQRLCITECDWRKRVELMWRLWPLNWLFWWATALHHDCLLSASGLYEKPFFCCQVKMYECEGNSAVNTWGLMCG